MEPRNKLARLAVLEVRQMPVPDMAAGLFHRAVGGPVRSFVGEANGR